MKQSAPWRPPFRRPGSLQARLGLVLGLLVLGVCVALAVLMARAAETQVLRQSGANLEVLSRQLARELSTGMDRFAQSVLTQTFRDRFRDPASSPESMRAALEEFVKANPGFAYASIIDARTRRVVAANGGIFEGGDASGRPTFEQGQRGLFIGDVHAAVRLAELLPRPADGEALRFLDASAPIFDADGRLIRVFASHMAWQWTDGLRNDIFGPLKDSHGIEAVLVDTRGKVVLAAAASLPVGTDLHAIAQRAAGPAELVRWPDGADYLTTASATMPHGDFPGFGWTVIARQPKALAARAASGLRAAFIVGALVLGCGGALLAWWASGRLLRPVRELARTARDAQAGEARGTADPHPAEPCEVAAVQRAIAQLARDTQLQAEARDLSERKFSTLVDSLPHRVFRTDAQGAIQELNRAWQEARDGGPAVRDGSLDALFDHGAGTELPPAWSACLAHGRALDIRCLLQPFGETEPRWYDVKARCVRDSQGAITGWIGTLVDVHRTVLDARIALQALHDERSAREKAEQLSRMRDEFLAIVSHELRSPLNVIAGWAEILRRKGLADPAAVKAAGIIGANVRQQASLIDDLLDITAVTAGRLELKREPVDAAQVAAEATAARLPQAQAKGVGLHCEAGPPAWVEGDRHRIAQMVSNLLDNAIKFTDSGGRVDVAVRTEDGTCRVAVRDSGRGIDPRFLPHVFEHMRQEDSSKTRRSGGLGLGLAIVHGLAALHRGSVEARSPGPGQGSTFVLSLPAPVAVPQWRMPAGADPGEPADGVPDLQGRRVLLVDDEPDAREMAQVALESLGADVRAVASGAEVLRLLQEDSFDVLVSDIGMPGMDGLTLVRHVRESMAAEALPAVALSAFAMETDRQAALAAGFQAYVTKPITLRRLSEAVNAALPLRRPSAGERHPAPVEWA
jgi:signal transduction histidine kinase/ActR/RegA family two-component response regulator